MCEPSVIKILLVKFASLVEIKVVVFVKALAQLLSAPSRVIIMVLFPSTFNWGKLPVQRQKGFLFIHENTGYEKCIVVGVIAQSLLPPPPFPSTTWDSEVKKTKHQTYL